MKEKIVTVDLSRLLKLTRRLIPDDPIELKLIEFYSNIVDRDNKSTIEEFTNHILGVMFYQKGDYDFEEIRNFFKPGVYLTIVEKFISYIDLLVIKECGIRYDTIKFNSYVSNTEESLIVNFKIT